jgi:APA family basic amino acid/polyamine antiporter
MSEPYLKRTLSLPVMILYGLGTTVGAGIYALTGEIAGIAGYLAPVAFTLAAIMAGLTAGSFAELSGRLPRAAGAALYAQHALGSAQMGRIVGLGVIAAGVVSSAALINGFVGYASYFVAWDASLIALSVVVALGAIACWGVSQSVTIAAIITVVEVTGLVIVIVTGADALAALPAAVTTIRSQPGATLALLSGALLAFYAFIGFEDMVDMAEEVKDVRRNLPRAIVWTLAITTLLYLSLTTVAVLSVPPAELAASRAPLADLFSRNTGWSGAAIALIGMFAIINGALIQALMASRVVYGLSSRRQLPRWLGVVNPGTRTPVRATLIVCAIILALALLGSLAGLARATSVIMLTIFAVVNLALWRIKSRGEPSPGFEVPRWWPLAGLIVSVGLVLHALLPLET